MALPQTSRQAGPLTKALIEEIARNKKFQNMFITAMEVRGMTSNHDNRNSAPKNSAPKLS